MGESMKKRLVKSRREAEPPTCVGGACFKNASGFQTDALDYCSNTFISGTNDAGQVYAQWWLHDPGSEDRVGYRG